MLSKDEMISARASEDAEEFAKAADSTGQKEAVPEDFWANGLKTLQHLRSVIEDAHAKMEGNHQKNPEGFRGRSRPG